MPCQNPPPLGDEAISEALDGTASPQTLAHLQHCPACSARLQNAGALERALADALHRWDCPPPGHLGDYHLGILSHNRQRGISAHLDICPRCKDEVEELRTYLTEEMAQASPSERSAPPPAQPAPLLRRLNMSVAQLLPSGPLQHLGGVRGTGRNPLIARGDVATIVLEPLPAEPQTVRLVGQIADELGQQERWNGALVEIRQGLPLVTVAFVDEVGGFSSRPVPTGPTELTITAEDGTSIVVADLVL